MDIENKINEIKKTVTWQTLQYMSEGYDNNHTISNLNHLIRELIKKVRKECEEENEDLSEWTLPDLEFMKMAIIKELRKRANISRNLDKSSNS